MFGLKHEGLSSQIQHEDDGKSWVRAVVGPGLKTSGGQRIFVYIEDVRIRNPRDYAQLHH